MRQPPALLLPTSITDVPSTAIAFWSVRNPLALLVSTLNPGTVFNRSAKLRVFEARSTIWLPVRTPERSALMVCN